MPLLPGYGAPELKQQVLSEACDIYSFGRTFYVLYHQKFPQNKFGRCSLDRFLLTCCAEDRKKRYQNMKEVKLQLHKTSSKKLGIIIGLIFCLFCSKVTHVMYEHQISSQYEAYIENHKLKEAMIYQCNERKAYERYLASVGRKEGLSHIFTWITQYELSLDTDIVIYLVRESIYSQDRYCYQQAKQLMQDYPIFERCYDSVLDSSSSLNDYFNELEKIKQRIDELPKEQRREQYALLASFYEGVAKDSKQHMEALLTLYSELNETKKEKELQYVYALWMLEHEPKQAREYVEQLEIIWNDDPECSMYLGNLTLEVFERCIPDEDKRSHLDLLFQAKQYLLKAKQNTFVEDTLLQIEYLLEKWR